MRRLLIPLLALACTTERGEGRVEDKVYKPSDVGVATGPTSGGETVTQVSVSSEKYIAIVSDSSGIHSIEVPSRIWVHLDEGDRVNLSRTRTWFLTWKRELEVQP